MIEAVEDRPSFVSRPMFGCVGCYLDGRLIVVLADRTEPWQGVLFPVVREVHSALRREFPALRIHPVLKKWLYLPSAGPGFAGAAEAIVRRIADGDPRFGVEPSPPRLPRRSRRGSRRRGRLV